VFVLALSLLSFSLPAGADSNALLGVGVQDGYVTVSLRLIEEPRHLLLARLQEGLKSEIIFQLRLYRKQKGPLSFLGDHLLVEKRVSQLAYRDLFENAYVVESPDGRKSRFEREEEFFDCFLQLTGAPLAEASGLPSRDLYVLARIILNPVRIAPPLNIIAFFPSQKGMITSWVESTLTTPGGRKP